MKPPANIRIKSAKVDIKKKNQLLSNKQSIGKLAETDTIQRAQIEIE